MKLLKNMTVIICLLTAPLACGMREKLKNMRDANTHGIYTDTKMLEALKEKNLIRINALLERAKKSRKNSLKTSPIGTTIVTTLVRSKNNEMLCLLLKNKAPIDRDALRIAITHSFYDILELLLKHDVPLGDAIFWAMDDNKALKLLVKYKPNGAYASILTYINEYHHRSHYKSVLKPVFWYVDTATLKTITSDCIPDQDMQDSHLPDFVTWFKDYDAALDKMPTLINIDFPYNAAITIFHMPNLTPPQDFSKLLAMLIQRNPKKLENLFYLMQCKDCNQAAFEMLLTMWLQKNIFEESVARDFLKRLNAPSEQKFEHDNLTFAEAIYTIAHKYHHHKVVAFLLNYMQVLAAMPVSGGPEEIILSFLVGATGEQEPFLTLEQSIEKYKGHDDIFDITNTDTMRTKIAEFKTWLQHVRKEMHQKKYLLTIKK